MHGKYSPEKMAKEAARLIYNTPNDVIIHMDNRLKELRYNLPRQCNDNCEWCFETNSKDV